MNTQVTDRWQLATHYGIKYVETEIAGLELKSITHLLGGETRFDISEKIDIGLHAQMLVNRDFSQASYGYGPSIGVSPAKNIWISLGYNFEGFRDDGFEAAETSQEGVFVKFRLKFDQHTARGLLRHISPVAYKK